MPSMLSSWIGFAGKTCWTKIFAAQFIALAFLLLFVLPVLTWGVWLIIRANQRGKTTA